VRGELQAALGDIGEVTQPAGVQNGASQVGVGARGEVDQCDEREHRERDRDDEEGRVSSRGRDPGSGDRGPYRQNDGRADIRAEAPGGEYGGEEQADSEEHRSAGGPGGSRGEPREPRPGSGDRQHRKDSLQLVADPVEANPEPWIRPQ
jgi:hypothetical protein